MVDLDATTQPWKAEGLIDTACTEQWAPETTHDTRQSWRTCHFWQLIDATKDMSAASRKMRAIVVAELCAGARHCEEQAPSLAEQVDGLALSLSQESRPWNCRVAHDDMPLECIAD